MKTCAALVVLLLALGLAACGGGDDDGGDEAAPPAATDDAAGTSPDGREVFTANCGSCHTLEDAGTTGAVGPPLDGHGLSEEEVEQQVRQGGGAMPAFEDTLDDDQIRAVAAYVAAQGGG